MRKLASVLLALALMLPLCACAETYTADEVADIKEAAFDRGYSSGYDDGYYDAQNSASWDEGEFLSDVDNAISPIHHAESIIEDYLNGDSASVDLDEIYFLLEEGLYNLAVMFD